VVDDKTGKDVTALSTSPKMIYTFCHLSEYDLSLETNEDAMHTGQGSKIKSLH
jgi:hypothetical protein